MKKILIINCTGRQCGVYQYGLHFFQTVKKITSYSWIYEECSSEAEFLYFIESYEPDIVIYNYHQPLLPFITEKLLNQTYGPIHICLAHELSEDQINQIDGTFFHYYLYADPSLEKENKRLFKLKRIIPNYQNTHPMPIIPTIGSYGFGSKIKGFDQIIEKVQEEFDEAIIRINIPSNSFFDKKGDFAHQIGEKLQSKIYKRRIKLYVTYEFFSDAQLLDFLAKNSINVFLYDPSIEIHGISSALDFALAVKRPIAVSQSNLFRHLFDVHPSVVVNFKQSFWTKFIYKIKGVEFSSLKQILSNGIENLKPLYANWSEDQFNQDVGQIIEKILAQSPSSPRKLNRILDDQAREEYQLAVDTLFRYCPETMTRKIPRANIQQAFVLDVVRFLAKPNSKILSVGSFEDTACEALIKMGYNVEAIDPVINYDLGTFYEIAKKEGKAFDLIFSTSVIEHVENDQLFMSQLSNLLKTGGKGIITCDFKDDWSPEQGIFPGSFRFYTQTYIQNEIFKALQGCKFVGSPEWNCPNPDFEYGGKKYTFATLVFEKVE